jgi:hypothetical protein
MFAQARPVTPAQVERARALRRLAREAHAKHRQAIVSKSIEPDETVEEFQEVQEAEATPKRRGWPKGKPRKPKAE